MGDPVTITDPDDPRVRDFTALTDVAARSVREPAEGLFIAEGAKVILRALAAGYRPRAVLTEPKWLPDPVRRAGGDRCARSWSRARRSFGR